MHLEFGSTVWLVVVAGGAAALAVVLIVATAMWLARDRDDAPTERSTRELYDEEEEAAAKAEEDAAVHSARSAIAEQLRP
ncbi:MAG: hypothetical protein ABUL42_02445 [Terricaulis silvestris]